MADRENTFLRRCGWRAGKGGWFMQILIYYYVTVYQNLNPPVLPQGFLFKQLTKKLVGCKISLSGSLEASQKPNNT